ncbi:hypothetical protein BKI49_26885 [Streptomyces sp. Tue6028]|nr:hypothetical protein BKI49_26885 [Streptomyces sp. Tue6028]
MIMHQPSFGMPSRGFARSFTEAAGNIPAGSLATPLTPDGRDPWAELEALPLDGIKDRSALSRFAMARARGDVRPGAAIVEHSNCLSLDQYSGPDDASTAPDHEHFGRQGTDLLGRRTPATRNGSGLCVLGERS